LLGSEKENRRDEKEKNKLRKDKYIQINKLLVKGQSMNN